MNTIVEERLAPRLRHHRRQDHHRSLAALKTMDGARGNSCVLVAWDAHSPERAPDLIELRDVRSEYRYVRPGDAERVEQCRDPLDLLQVVPAAVLRLLPAGNRGEQHRRL